MISISTGLRCLPVVTQLPLWLALGGCAPTTETAIPAARGKVQMAYGKVPMSFEANEGQADPSTKFLGRGRGYGVFLQRSKFTLVYRKEAAPRDPRRSDAVADFLQTHATPPVVVETRLVGGETERIVGLEELPGKVNYFTGSDPTRWRTGVPTFGKVKYESVYPGVDLVFHSSERDLEYDFVVAPGASHETIRLAFDEADHVTVDGQGNLRVRASGQEIVHQAPVIFQESDGVRTRVTGGYVLHRDRQVGFHVGEYDRSRPLVIDPVLAYSTFLGGSQSDNGTDIAVDSAGRAYVVGSTSSPDFPMNGPIQGAGGMFDVFVTRLDPTGSVVEFSTYLGGSADEGGFGIAVDSAGHAYICGFTQSSDFPTTAGAFQNSLSGPTDAFVAKMSSTGSLLLYSTYLGGNNFNDAAVAIAIDSAGAAHVTGITQSTDFPTTPTAFDTTCGGDGTCTGDTATDAFVTKLTSDGSGLVFSTYLGGDGRQEGSSGIALDALGNVYITGHTTASNFPVLNPYQPTCPVTCGGGITSGFVTKLSSTGQSLVYSTYLGGMSDDRGLDIAVDAVGRAVVVGFTRSADFPATAGALDPFCGTDGTCNGGFSEDGFLTALTPTGSGLVFSTYLGGSSSEIASGVALETSGAIYLTGRTSSADFPSVNPIQPTNAGSSDFFAARVSADGSSFLFSSYLGGSSMDGFGPLGGDGKIAVDGFNNAYVTGATLSNDFPTTSGAFDVSCGTDGTCNGGFVDGFVAKLAADMTLVAIDIKPGSFPNSINTRKKGVIPVAVLGTPAFDPASVDPATVCFGEADDTMPSQRDCSVAPGTVLVDANKDGIFDLVLHFETQETGIDSGDTQACLTGELFDSTSIEGCDSIKTK